MANYDFLPGLLQMYQSRNDPAQQVLNSQPSYVLNPNNPEQFIPDQNSKYGSTWADISQTYNPSGVPFNENDFNRVANDPTYTSMYGPAPVNGSDADKQAYMTLVKAGGGMYSGTQSSAFDRFSGDYGGLVPIAMFAAPALAGAAGGLGVDAAAGSELGGSAFLGAGEPAADAALGELGINTALPAGTEGGIAAGTSVGDLAGSYGSAGLDAVNTALSGTGASLTPGSTFDSTPSLPSTPSVPPGTTTAAQTLAKMLLGDTGSGGSGTGSISGFMQGAQPAQQSYMRKSLPFMDQPAFLGNGQQQALGSAEDTAFNQMLSDQGNDISSRAKQMAAQLRGRPGMFSFRST